MTTSPRSDTLQPLRVPLRLLLDPDHPARPLDGAWWPQTRDLERELVDLADDLPAEVGDVTGMRISRLGWNPRLGTRTLREVRTQRGLVRVESLPDGDAHLIVLVLSDGRQLRLLVVPAGTKRGVARGLMNRATDDRNNRSAKALIAMARSQFGTVSSSYPMSSPHQERPDPQLRPIERPAGQPGVEWWWLPQRVGNPARMDQPERRTS
ncbi:DUF5994 family protein [Pimelobacter simplex]|uniref:DUF5994 family protein n=1 Tax=Nocardioides simplex TaxID=2045 RepID=UPI003AAC9446